MAYRRINQVEARRLKQRVETLERRMQNFVNAGWPGGTHLYVATFEKAGVVFGRLQTARRLGCMLIATISDDGTFNVYAVKP